MLAAREFLVMLEEASDHLHVYFRWLETSASTATISIASGVHYIRGDIDIIPNFNGALYLMDGSTIICSLQDSSSSISHIRELDYYQPYLLSGLI